MDKASHAAAIFDKYAQQYHDKYMDIGLYKDSFDFFCSHLKENASILELACGPGNITQYLLKIRPDLKIFGIDLSPNMIALAKINNPTADFQLMDCRDIACLGKKYDAIMCGFALPYLSKEETIKLMDDASEILEPKGLIYISTMEDDYSKSGIQTSSGGDQMYMYFYEADFLIRILEENGFTILNIDRKQYILNGVDTTDLLIIAKK